MNVLRQFRSEGKYSEAIDALIRVCRSEKSDIIEARSAIMRESLFGERCLVLEWAIDEIAHKRRDQCGDRLKALQDAVTPLMAASAKLFVARLGLIQTVMLDSGDTNTVTDEDKLETAIVTLLCEVQERWNYERHQDVKTAEKTDFVPTPDKPLNGPSFLAHLSSDRHRALFHHLAAQHGWMHPGLLVAGETIAALEGQHERADHNVTNWIMFAAKVQDRSEGIFARLTMERIPAGDCRGGMLVPDPLSSGYLHMQESFSTGLQHAWLATHKYDSSTRTYDWRWRIEIEEARVTRHFQKC